MAGMEGAGWRGRGEASRFSGSGVCLYFFSDANTLQLLDETTGLIRIVARLDGHSAQEWDHRVSRSAYLVFSERSSLRNDLMLVEGFR
jgi:hypothetical protein